MIKVYRIACDKYRKFKKPKIYILKKKLGLSIVCSKRGHEYKKMFIEKELIEILKILVLSASIEEYQKIYNHD